MAFHGERDGDIGTVNVLSPEGPMHAFLTEASFLESAPLKIPLTPLKNQNVANCIHSTLHRVVPTLFQK